MLTSTQQMQLDYWTGFEEFVSRNRGIVTAPPYHQSFLIVARIPKIRTCRFAIEVAMNTRVGYIRAALELKGEVEDTARCFDRLRRDRDAIESEVGDTLVWHDPGPLVHRRSIEHRLAAEVWNRSERLEQYRWLLDGVEAFQRAFEPRIRVLRTH